MYRASKAAMVPEHVEETHQILTRFLSSVFNAHFCAGVRPARNELSKQCELVSRRHNALLVIPATHKHAHDRLHHGMCKQCFKQGPWQSIGCVYMKKKSLLLASPANHTEHTRTHCARLHFAPLLKQKAISIRQPVHGHDHRE